MPMTTQVSSLLTWINLTLGESYLENHLAAGPDWFLTEIYQ